MRKIHSFFIFLSFFNDIGREISIESFYIALLKRFPFQAQIIFFIVSSSREAKWNLASKSRKARQ